MQFCKRINRQNLGGVLIVLALAFMAGLAVPALALAQDSSAETNMFRGDRPEISVTVRDSGGAEIASPATVRVYRSGVPTDTGTTRKGRVFFMLPSTGDYSVQVSATGYESSQKDIAIPVALKAEVEFNLKRKAESNETSGVPAGPVLAPKAKEAFEKGLQALGAGKIKDAQKYSGEAMGLGARTPRCFVSARCGGFESAEFCGCRGCAGKGDADRSHARARAGGVGNGAKRSGKIRRSDSCAGEIARVGRGQSELGDAVHAGAGVLQAGKISRGCQNVASGAGDVEWKGAGHRVAPGAVAGGDREV